MGRGRCDVAAQEGELVGREGRKEEAKGEGRRDVGRRKKGGGRYIGRKTNGGRLGREEERKREEGGI